METEILATTAVKKRIAQTEYLSPFINEGDKEPSWDGHIYAYADGSKKKEKLVGRAAVQVKGLKRKNLNKNTINYSMDIADLKNYRTDGGIVLFVVYIDQTMQERIYYSSLTPFYLNEIIRVSSQSNRKPKLSLKTLPASNDELCNIVFNFIRDCERQSVVRNGHIWTIEEVADLFGKDNIELNLTYTGIGYDVSNPFSYLSKNEFYMYAQNKSGTISIPLHHIEHLEMQCQEKPTKVIAGDLEYIDRISFVQHRKGINELRIGKNLCFTSKGGKTFFQYRITGNLNERIRTIETLIKMVEFKTITVNSVKIDINPSVRELNAFDLEDKKNQLRFYRSVKETLDRLNVKKSLAFDDLTEKEFNNLKMLVNTILHDKDALFKENDNIPPVCTLEFANIRVILSFHQKADGRYIVEDFFDTKMICAIDKNDNYRTTPFCILLKEDYLYADNLVLEKVVEGFKQYDNDGHMEKMVLCILEMIKAYDSDNNRTEILKSAKDLCGWMMEKRPNDIINKINYLQCCLRERELTSVELDELSDIVLNETMNPSILAGANILLGSKVMAQKYLNMLEESQRKEFESYPIYKLYERM